MRYRTIVADPPWDHSDGFVTELKSGPAYRGLPYECMDVEDILEIPVREMADKDCRLFLWTTNRWMPDAFDVLHAWGFRYVQTLVWDKPDPNRVTGSMAPNAEFLLVGRCGAPRRTGRFPGPVLRMTSTAHSEKPDAWMDYIESASPGPYLELFARRQRLGWDTWGNEALCHVDIVGTTSGERDDMHTTDASTGANSA